jgi:hypothetical protein
VEINLNRYHFSKIEQLPAALPVSHPGGRRQATSGEWFSF